MSNNEIWAINRAQVEEIKKRINEIPILQDLLIEVIEALDMRRTIKIVENVRAANNEIEPLSYDKGMNAAISFLNELIRRKE